VILALVGVLLCIWTLSLFLPNLLM